MSITEADVQRLVAAGVIDAATGSRIEAFESARAQETRRNLPSVAELAVYLATAIVGAGVVVLINTNWGSLPALARVAIPAGAGAVALGSGTAIGTSSIPASGRAKSIAWLLGATLVVAATGVAGNEAGLNESNAAIVAAAVAIPISIGLWWVCRTHAQLLGIAGAAFLLATALSSLTDESPVTVVGLVLVSAGLLALVATETGWLEPRITARLLSGTGMAVGVFFAGLPPGPTVAELVALVATAVLITASVRFGTLMYTVFGVLTAFLGLVTAILRHIESPTLAAMALIAVGLAMLATIAAITRYRPWRSAGA